MPLELATASTKESIELEFTLHARAPHCRPPYFYATQGSFEQKNADAHQWHLGAASHDAASPFATQSGYLARERERERVREGVREDKEGRN